MAVAWFVRRGAEVLGPLSAGGMHRLTMAGQITHATLVRRGTNGPWVEARQVPALFDGAAGQTHPSPRPKNSSASFDDEDALAWLNEPKAGERPKPQEPFTWEPVSPPIAITSETATRQTTGSLAKPTPTVRGKSPARNKRSATDDTDSRTKFWKIGAVITFAAVVAGIFILRTLQRQSEQEQLARVRLQEILRREEEEDKQEAQRIQQIAKGGKQAAAVQAKTGGDHDPPAAAQPTAEQQAAEAARQRRYQQPVATLTSDQAEQLAGELKGDLSTSERSAVAKVVVNAAFVSERKLPPGDFYRILVMAYRAALKRRGELKVASLDDSEATKVANLILSPE